MSKYILITGASSGIGEALAKYYARQGCYLALCARSLDKLQSLQNSLQQQGAQAVYCYQLDVCHSEQVYSIIEQARQELGQLDMVIANAGIGGSRRSGSQDLAVDHKVLATNLHGAIATIDAAIAIFKQQGYGHLVGMSSFSAYVGIPGCAAYSASKAALSNYLQAVHLELLKSPIQISVIHPGFIHTNIDENIAQYPFVIPAEKAAYSMGKALAKGKKDIIIPGWPWRLFKWILPFIPDAMIRKIF